MKAGASSPTSSTSASRAPPSTSSKPSIPSSASFELDAPRAASPTSRTASSCGSLLRTLRSLSSCSGVTTAARAPQCARTYSSSDGVANVLAGTATEPTAVVPRNAATNSGQSAEMTATRSPRPTPSDFRASPNFLTATSSCAYVSRRSPQRIAVRDMRPSARAARKTYSTRFTLRPLRGRGIELNVRGTQIYFDSVPACSPLCGGTLLTRGPRKRRDAAPGPRRRARPGQAPRRRARFDTAGGPHGEGLSFLRAGPQVFLKRPETVENTVPSGARPGRDFPSPASSFPQWPSTTFTLVRPGRVKPCGVGPKS